MCSPGRSHLLAALLVAVAAVHHVKHAVLLDHLPVVCVADIQDGADVAVCPLLLFPPLTSPAKSSSVSPLWKC